MIKAWIRLRIRIRLGLLEGCKWMALMRVDDLGAKLS